MNFLFGFSGRIGRGGWWLGELIVFLVLVALFAILAASLGSGIPRSAFESREVLNYISPSAIAVMCSLVALSTWINVAVTVKRYHDRGKSGWWFLIVLIPYVGGLWQLVECGFLRGSDGLNVYDAPDDDGQIGWGGRAERFERPTSRMAVQDTRPVHAPNQMSARRPTGPTGFGKRGV